MGIPFVKPYAEDYQQADTCGSMAVNGGSHLTSGDHVDSKSSSQLDHDYREEANGGTELSALTVEDGKTDDSSPPRPLWSHQIDFILSVVGFAVGLGNIWRFPYLCYKNGGGAFLVPYFVVLIFGGIPIFFMEIALGQYMSQGGLGAWNICPIFKGIGIATTIIVFLLNIYYIVVLAWNVYYCFMSFTLVLPWSHCDNEWNTDRCRVHFNKDCNNTLYEGNISSTCPANDNATTWVDPVVEFWTRKVLEISPGVDEPNGVVGHLALSLLIVWIVCYFCVWKGIRWTGKVVYFTALFPYVVLTVLLVRGLTLDGAAEGIVYYLKPDFSRLADSQVWIDAGTQIFFSYAVALGAMTALGSYNKFHTNFYRICTIICCVNSGTSLYAGFAIFSVLGFMANEQGIPISQVAESGPGLVFIAYPKAVTQLPFAPLWAILFFIMIFLLGLDSQFVGLEAVITVGTDMFPVFRRRKEIFIAAVCIVSYIIGLSMVTRGGMYVFQLFDYYSASGMSLLWVCLFQCIAIAWVYGANRFYDNWEQMLGFRINRWLKICWLFITPVLTAGIFVFMWAQYKPLTYNRTYAYPEWVLAIGMCMAFASMACIPIYFVVRLICESGTLRERWKILTTPILIPKRVPAHWSDAAYLREVGNEYLKHPHSIATFFCADSVAAVKAAESRALN